MNEQLRDIRKRLGLTEEQLAQRLDVTHSAVSKWERKVRPPVKVTYVEWAAALGCRIERLVLPVDSRDHPVSDLDRGLIDALLAALPHMPDKAKRALQAQLAVYVESEQP